MKTPGSRNEPTPPLIIQIKEVFAIFTENELQHINLVAEEENSIIKSLYMQLILSGYYNLEGEALREKIIEDLLNDDTPYPSH